MNRRRPLFWKLYLPIALTALGGILAFAVFSFISVRNERLQTASAEALTRLQTIKESLAPWIFTAQPSSIDSLCKRLGPVVKARVTVVTPTGSVIGDSQEIPTDMPGLRSRPEIASALNGEVGLSVRFDALSQVKTVFVAAPIHKDSYQGSYQDSAIVGAIRLAAPMGSLRSPVSSIVTGIVSAGFAGLLLAALVSYILSRRIREPLQMLTNWAQQDDALASSQASAPALPGGVEEVMNLQSALFKLRGSQDKRLSAALRQADQQRAVFQSMSEGVFAIDLQEEIVSANRVACEWFGLDVTTIAGRSVQETLRNADLERIIRATLALRTKDHTQDAVNDELILPAGKVLSAHGVALCDEKNEQIGVVIMLHDVTEVRKLESVRSEFVANVSHELKTPITSIKGYIETLLLDTEALTENQRKFLDIAARQSDRLQAIIDDLLTLSRIERESDLEREALDVDALFKSVRVFCQQQADQKSIAITVSAPENLSVTGNSRLLEQALINLLDNALKYSEPNTTVTLEALTLANEIALRVLDEGVGIEEKHLPRLFERFYRTDRARSRKAGGSGLGLAIVKHIALAHGGRVEVESSVGSGSVFSVILPKRPS